jgi:riboflavin kinase/FMN adenylyltransferase
MQVYKSLEGLPQQENSCLTLGTFDGIHIGHQKIIDELIKKSRHFKGRSILITFNTHPQNVVNNHDNAIPVLTSQDEKLQLLKKKGLDVVIILSFTDLLAKMQPDIFIKTLLSKITQVKKFVIGYNHAFGRNRGGDVKILNELGNHFGFSVDIVPAVLIDGKVVSSTFIRKLILEGCIVQASQLLGRNYNFSGTVKSGQNLGTQLGFPTANLRLLDEDKIIPGDGVYAVRVKINTKNYTGMANIGTSPTVKGKKRRIEIHIHNYSGNLYNRNLEVEFIERIRNEKKFESVEALVYQLKKDKERSNEILSNY